MPQHSPDIVEKFGAACDWASQSWQMGKYLFDDNPKISSLMEPHYQPFFSRMNIIVQEYWISQVTKLHDPASQGRLENLSVAFMIDHGDWSPSTRTQLIALSDSMDRFVTKLQPARNKILAHIDVQTVMNGTTLGCFDAGEDVSYFGNLMKFCSIVYDVVFGAPFVNDDLVANDVAFFMEAFDRGRIKPHPTIPRE